jgi:predicted choloylglycine hydrolase
MRVIAFSGDHYQLGHLIGTQSKAIFASHIKPSSGFQTLLQWKESDWLSSVKKAIAADAPTVYQELQGIADGAEQPLDEVILWNARGDLIHCIPEGCTSIGVTQPSLTLVAHNEDGDPALKPHVFILQAELTTEAANFTSFVYPASVPGHSFAMNQHGLAFSVNNIRLTEHQVGLPRMITARLLLECKDHQAFIKQLEEQQRTGAFHYTVADMQSRQAFSVEAPFQAVSSLAAAPVRVHANHLVHDKLASVSQIITDSSDSRQVRMQALADSHSGEEVLAQHCLQILRDKHHDVLPVFRTSADDPDEENTLATAVFSFTDRGALMQVFSPNDDSETYRRRITHS